MKENPRNKEWARGYARQALSDPKSRESLVKANADKCHRLHFLQMAAEKVCKAHLAITQGHEKVRKSHACVARTLPIVARPVYGKIYNNAPMPSWQTEKIRLLAKEIEVLSPACDDGDVRKDNSEYPWEDGKGNILIPCEYNFPNISGLASNRSLLTLPGISMVHVTLAGKNATL